MSGIVIDVKAGATFEKSSVSATGKMVHVITDSERYSFGIGSDSDLKRAVENDFGKQPNDAYLHSPTPWNDLYKSYGWPEVQTVLEPIRAEILEVNTNPNILTTNTLTNDSDYTATFTSNISAEVTDSVSSTWSSSSKVSFQQKIEYKFKFLGIGAGGESTFGFEQEWGRSETHTRESKAGAGMSVSVELKPKESAIVELSASTGTMRVKVTYEAHLKGDVAVNYNPPYKGHHFWGLPIGEVIRGSNRVEVVEDVEVGFYCNATAKVSNAITNEIMLFSYARSPNEPSIKA